MQGQEVQATARALACCDRLKGSKQTERTVSVYRCIVYVSLHTVTCSGPNAAREPMPGDASVLQAFDLMTQVCQGMYDGFVLYLVHFRV